MTTQKGTPLMEALIRAARLADKHYGTKSLADYRKAQAIDCLIQAAIHVHLGFTPEDGILAPEHKMIQAAVYIGKARRGSEQTV